MVFWGRVSPPAAISATVANRAGRRMMRLAAAPSSTAASLIILRPARFATVAEIAAGGETLPQKTTYFYPKPRDGLVLRPLE